MVTAAVSGAVISTLGRPLGSQVVCATSDTAARIDEIQIDLGEGPSWQALRTRLPVLEADLRHVRGSAWPGALEALRKLDIGALFAFPLFVGDLGVGSVDLYSHDPRQLSQSAVDDVAVLATVAARHLLRCALDELDHVEEGMTGGPYSRRDMHQAAGMIAVQLTIGVGDALLVLRARAFSTGRSVAEISLDVVARRLSFAL